MTRTNALATVRLLIALVPCVVGAAASAGPPSLVYDFNPTPRGSTPVRMISLGDRLLFNAYTPETGLELWTSDGTAAGTLMLTDLYPGSGDGVPIRGGWTQLFEKISTPDGDRVLFCGDNGSSGDELFITDGTATGTRLLKDLSSSYSGGNPTRAWTIDGVVYFAADTSSDTQDAIWRTDGTPEGTQLLGTVPTSECCRSAEIVASAGSKLFVDSLIELANYQYREVLVCFDTRLQTLDILRDGDLFSNGTFGVAGGKLIFQGSSDGVDYELWSSDGTAAGTGLLSDLYPGPAGSWPSGFMALGDEVLFCAVDPSTGRPSLWRTDGTAAGTTVIRPIGPPGENTHLLSAPIQFGGRLIFRMGGSYWITDGTDSGTRTLAGDAIAAVGLPYTDGSLYYGSRTQYYAVSESGAELFLLGKARTSGSVPQVWRLTGDPMTAGVEQISSVYQTTTTNIDGVGLFTLLFEGRDYRKMMMAAYAPGAGIELVKCDAPPPPIPARPQSTALVKDILPDNESFVGSAAAIGRSLAVFQYTSTGVDLWLSDGTPSNTRRQFTLDSLATPNFAFGTAGSVVYFNQSVTPHSAAAIRPWRSDGTPEGTYPLGDGPSPAVGPCTNWTTVRESQDVMYFVCSAASRQQLWRSDSTVAGTSLVTTLPSTSHSFGPIIDAGGSPFFFVFDASTSSAELWRTGGTVDDTALVRSFAPNAIVQSTLATCASDGRLFFTASTAENGEELWVSDGTSDGTHVVVDLAPGTLGASPRWITALPQSGMVIFTARGAPGQGLWRSDGTASGTSLIVSQQSNGYPVSKPVALGSLAYYTSRTVAGQLSSYQLYSTNGTVDGTRPIPMATGWSSSTTIVPFGDKLAYIGTTPEMGAEMFVYDPRAEVSRLPGEIRRGPRSGALGSVLAGVDRLYVRGSDGFHGTELWVATDCPADFNNDAAVTVQDIFDYLDAFYAREPRADVDGQGGVTVGDVLDWLGSYFAGCDR